MTEKEREKLSALTDDELSAFETPGAVKKLIRSEDQQASWSRYHLIGDVMRQETGPAVMPNLAASIRQRLEDEPVVLAPGNIGRRWIKPVAGAAIAASVALMAVMVAPQFINPEQGGTSLPQVAVNQLPNERTYASQRGTRWELLAKPEVESRLNSYLVNHHGYAPAGNMKGIMPYATFVSYDGAR
ncbi:hypothetical protein DJ030_11845 [bacterium endosymbiont of Escarpia laminata]|nr:MAG: hypothetical protein DJ031_13050 [bacterium endosymbiont of Escarpia laminata]RLJ18393.1 MAG: hypothetical protein DJ030_11845 [bacterium endosymbiont of Escarpia laminata]